MATPRRHSTASVGERDDELLRKVQIAALLGLVVPIEVPVLEVLGVLLNPPLPPRDVVSVTGCGRSLDVRSEGSFAGTGEREVVRERLGGPRVDVVQLLDRPAFGELRLDVERLTVKQEHRPFDHPG